MKNMTLENIALAAGGVYHGPQAAKKLCIKGAVLDSRILEEGFLFFATKGEKVDGHIFIRQVYEKGALCVISERELTEADIPSGMEVSYIQVTDSFQALKDVAAFYRSRLSIPVVGITGSVGKTSTKEMIAGVLSAKYQVCKTEGNFNNEVGLPLTVLRIRDEHEVAVLEMGISDFGEMSRLTQIAKPDICVITNIGQCHLENLGTRDGVLKAKTEIFEGLSENGHAVLNGQDDKLITIREVKGRAPLFFGGDECYATDVESRGIYGSSGIIHLGEETVKADIRVPGVHQMMNAMAAVRVAKLLGLSVSEMERGISSVEAIGGRNHVVEKEKLTIIDDCYNANPVSMKAALDLLSLALTRKVAILGDMFELGENSDALHEGVGAYAVEKGIDVLICIGEGAAFLQKGALEKRQELGTAKPEIWHFADKNAFLQESSKLLQKGDTVLLKASHGMHFEELLDQLE